MKFNFNNLSINFQILTPVLLTITFFVVTVGVVKVMLNNTYKNALEVNAIVSEVSDLVRAQRNIYRFRMAASEAYSGSITWKEAENNFIERQEIVTDILKRLEDDNADILSEDEEESVRDIINGLISYQKLIKKMGSYREQIQAMHSQLPWFHTYINKTNEIVLESSLLNHDKDRWRATRAELFVESTRVQTYFAELIRYYEPETVEKLQRSLLSIKRLLVDLNLSLVNQSIGKTLVNYEQSFNQINLLFEEVEKEKEVMGKLGFMLRDTLGSLALNAEGNALKASEESLVLLDKTGNTLMLSILFASMFAFIVATYCAKKIKSNLIGLLSVVNSLANGELTKKTGVLAKNELGHLCQSTDKTIDTLNKTVKSLALVGTDVSSSATELASVMVELESNVIDQKSQIEMIASAITELAASSTQVASNANSAETYAKSVLEVTEEGVYSAKLGAELSVELAEELKATTAVAESLQKLSENVTGFVNMIENVAEQTNLLALNAAIEAARAGSSGKGFAVVADEVRVLAQRTSDNTGSIQELVVSLQNRSKDMFNSVERCMQKVEESAEISRQTSDQLTKISSEVANISSSNSEMAAAANEQSVAISSVNESINTIDDGLSQNVEGIKQSSEASAFLSELSETQSNQLRFFKV